MLEPNKPPRLMRRRLVRQTSSTRPVAPAPMRSPEGHQLFPSLPPHPMEMRQPGYSATPPKLTNSTSARRAPRPSGQKPAAPEDNTRFNLRNLLGDRSNTTPGRSSQRRKDGRPSGRRSGHPQGSHLSYPISPPYPANGLQPNAFTPSPNLSRPSSRSKLTSIQRSGEFASTKGQVRVLTPHPIVAPVPARSRHPQRRPRRKPSPLLYITRLLILGIGIGAIAGTILSIWDPATRIQLSPQPTSGLPLNGNNITTAGTSRDLTPGGISPLPVALRLNQPIAPLASRIQSLTAQYPGLSPGVFVVDLDTGAYLDLNGEAIFSAASTIKVPIFVAFLQDVDAGKIRLDEMLTIQQADIATGSGDLQDQPVGTQYSALDTAIKMITISDNTATNMLIRQMGGAAALNQRFRAWGLNNTLIRNPLADLEGTNVTSPKDLTGLLAMVSQGDLLSLRSRDRLFDIMQNTITNTLIPSGVDPGATVAHKTGNIDTMVGDTGIVDMPTGKRFIITVIVQRQVDDDRAQELIRQISKEVYQHFNNVHNPQFNSPLPNGVSPPSGETAPTRVPSESNPYPTGSPTSVPNESLGVPLPTDNPYSNPAVPTFPARGNR